jgi:hypothetical protein
MERFYDEGIIIIMLRSKNAKQALQQGVLLRSRFLTANSGFKSIRKWRRQPGVPLVASLQDDQFFGETPENPLVREF